MPGRSESVFTDQAQTMLEPSTKRQKRGAVRCWASRMEGERHPPTHRLYGGLAYRITLSHRVIRHHTPWDEFQTRFPPKHALRGTHNENQWWLGKYFVEKVAYVEGIAGRIQYALPVAEKPSSENRPRGCDMLSP